MSHSALNAPATTAHRSALLLALFTVAYNLCEGGASVFFSTLDGSPALLGFGADSFVESLSGAVMVWRFWHARPAPEREHVAARLVGLSFLILAVYVIFEAGASLLQSDKPQPSLAALVIAVLSLVVMPALFVLKRRIAVAISSRSLLADARQTLACMLLSVALLAGAGLNYGLGWWQADPIAGFAIALYLVWEGYQTLTTGEVCEC